MAPVQPSSMQPLCNIVAASWCMVRLTHANRFLWRPQSKKFMQIVAERGDAVRIAFRCMLLQCNALTSSHVKDRPDCKISLPHNDMLENRDPELRAQSSELPLPPPPLACAFCILHCQPCNEKRVRRSKKGLPWFIWLHAHLRILHTTCACLSYLSSISETTRDFGHCRDAGRGVLVWDVQHNAGAQLSEQIMLKQMLVKILCMCLLLLVVFSVARRPGITTFTTPSLPDIRGHELRLSRSTLVQDWLVFTHSWATASWSNAFRQMCILLRPILLDNYATNWQP